MPSVSRSSSTLVCTILRFAKQEKPWVFATLENTTPENSVQCLQYLQKQYDAC